MAEITGETAASATAKRWVHSLGAKPRAELSRGYTIYITFVLALVALLTAVDSNMMSVLLPQIQKSLHVSNAAMGAMQGFAYSFVFAIIALPIGRLADKANRRNIMAISAVIWSLGTVLCGFAGSYVQLLLARMGVATGTASQAPVGASFIGDLYSPERRGTAIAAMLIGGLIGLGGGATLAGVLSDHYGWHVTFLMLGLPGLAAAAIIWLTVPEPTRGAKDGGVQHDPFSASTWASLKYIFSIPSVWFLAIAQCLLTAGQGAWLLWLPTFFQRVHHLTASQAGATYGVVVVVGAFFSIMIGGVLGDWLSRRGPRWRTYYVALSCLISAPFAAWGVLAGDLKITVLAIFIYSLIAGGVSPATAAAQLGVVRPTQRALMSAALSFIVLALAGGIGPIVIGGTADALTKTYGQMAIRYALLLSPALGAAAGLAFFAASRTIDKDTAAALGPAAQPAAAAK